MNKLQCAKRPRGVLLLPAALVLLRSFEPSMGFHPGNRASAGLRVRVHQSSHDVPSTSRRSQCVRFAVDVDESDLEAPLQQTAESEAARINHLAEDESKSKDQSTITFPSNISLSAVALLNIVAVIWGTQHAVIKTVVDDCDASAFSFARFGLAFLLVARYVPSFGPVVQKLVGSNEGEGASQSSAFNGAGNGGEDKDAASASIDAWRWGAEMGLWMFLGYAFQAIGLEFTTAQRSGFLLYLNVKFVPFFARLLLGREISIPTWASAFAALVGTALLSYDGSATALNVGDLWSVAAAAASAMFILRLESASAAVPDSSALNAACLLVVTVASFVWTVGEAHVSSSIEIASLMDAYRITIANIGYTVQNHPIELIYLGGVTTALANYIQTKAQKDISAERASIIYAMDPVYGAVFANVFLGETLNSFGMVGAGIITVAAATNAFLDLGTDTKEEEIAVPGVEEDSSGSSSK